MDDKTLGRIESHYRFFVWVSRLALPISGFVYGYMAYSEAWSQTQTVATVHEQNLMNMIFLPGILITLFALVARVFYDYAYKDRMFLRYAEVFKSNKGTADPKRLISPDSILLSRTCSAMFMDYASGTYINRDFFVGVLSVGYFDLSGFTRYDSVIAANYVVFAVRLDGQFPHIFVDAHAQNFLTPKNRNLWTLHWKLKTADRAQKLEGDFPRHFDVYAVPGRQIETLSILTPDVMQVMQDLGRGFDYEIIEGYLYIIAEPNVLRAKKTDQVVAALTASFDELVHQLRPSHYKNSKAYLRTGLQKLAALTAVYYYLSVYCGVIIFPVLLLVCGMLGGSLLRYVVELFS